MDVCGSVLEDLAIGSGGGGGEWRSDSEPGLGWCLASGGIGDKESEAVLVWWGKGSSSLLVSSCKASAKYGQVRESLQCSSLNASI